MLVNRVVSKPVVGTRSELTVYVRVASGPIVQVTIGTVLLGERLTGLFDGHRFEYVSALTFRGRNRAHCLAPSERLERLPSVQYVRGYFDKDFPHADARRGSG